MCVVTNIREIAEKHLDAKLKDLSVNIPNYKHIAINIMIAFGKEVCELQKTQCLIEAQADFNYDGFIYNNDESGYRDVEAYVKETSISNCKNICDEN